MLKAAALGAAALPAGALAVHHPRGGGGGGGGGGNKGRATPQPPQRSGAPRAACGGGRRCRAGWRKVWREVSTAEALQTLAGYSVITLKAVCQYHGTPLLASLAQLRQMHPGRHLIPTHISSLRLELCACPCS